MVGGMSGNEYTGVDLPSIDCC